MRTIFYCRVLPSDTLTVESDVPLREDPSLPDDDADSVAHLLLTIGDTTVLLNDQQVVELRSLCSHHLWQLEDVARDPQPKPVALLWQTKDADGHVVAARPA